MATTTRTRPAATRTTRTVRHAPVVSGTSPAGFGTPRPSEAPARPRSGGRTQQGTPRAQATAPAPAPAPRSRSRSSRSGGLSYRPRPSRPNSGSLSDTSYGNVILAEFVGVVLVIALAPVAKGESTSGVSPYAGGDMVKLAAATLLYAILAFVATTGRGAARLSAWFGGLALITVGLAEGAVLAQEVGLFTGNLLAATQGPAPAAGGPTLQQQQDIQGVAPAALNLPPAVIANQGIPAFGPGEQRAPIQ